MRYLKGCISLSPEHDYPLLRQVLHSSFVTHDQLFEFMQLGHFESNRWTFNWRVRRLAAHGLILRHTASSLGKGFVYSITEAGALELAGTGERFLVTPIRANRSDKEPQAAHSIELSEIQLSLVRAGLLVRWVPENQVRLRNAMMGVVNGKVYDAIVTTRLAGGNVTFALEYERTAKSEDQYADVLEKFDSEQDLDRFLYLASCEDVLRLVSWQFRNSRRHVCFGLLNDWYRLLLDAEVFDWKSHQYRPLRTALSESASLGRAPSAALA